MDNTYPWHDLFHRPHLLRRLQEGPFGSYLEELAVSLQQQHYSRLTIQRALCAADHFGRWLQQQNLRLEDAHELNRLRYCHLLGRCNAGAWPHRIKGLSLVVRFLQKQGIAKQPAELALDGSPREECLPRFEQYLERVVGAAPSTRQRYRPILLRFLRRHGGDAEPDWSRLSADNLTTFLQQEASQRKGFGRKVPGVALRSFLSTE